MFCFTFIPEVTPILFDPYLTYNQPVLSFLYLVKQTHTHALFNSNTVSRSVSLFSPNILCSKLKSHSEWVLYVGCYSILNLYIVLIMPLARIRSDVWAWLTTIFGNGVGRQGSVRPSIWVGVSSPEIICQACNCWPIKYSTWSLVTHSPRSLC